LGEDWESVSLANEESAVGRSKWSGLGGDRRRRRRPTAIEEEDYRRRADVRGSKLKLTKNGSRLRGSIRSQFNL
jgi:hypothetical protein